MTTNLNLHVICIIGNEYLESFQASKLYVGERLVARRNRAEAAEVHSYRYLELNSLI